MKSSSVPRRLRSPESIGDNPDLGETSTVDRGSRDTRVHDVLTDIALHNRSTRIITKVGRMVLDPNTELSFSAIRSLATPELRNKGDVKVRAMYQDVHNTDGPNKLEVTDLGIVEFVGKGETKYHPIPLTPGGEVDVIEVDNIPPHVKDRMAKLAMCVVGGELKAELGSEIVPEVVHD